MNNTMEDAIKGSQEATLSEAVNRLEKEIFSLTDRLYISVPENGVEKEILQDRDKIRIQVNRINEVVSKLEKINYGLGVIG